MRPPRIAILVFFLVASTFIVFRSLTSSTPRVAYSTYPSQTRPGKSVWGFMYYNTPFSLFPANAAISLTDDNSTSFAARPAAFGPKLAPKGLSGQLWVGSGFAEDSLGANGELGCSDLPEWNGGNTRASFKYSAKSAVSHGSAIGEPGTPKRGGELLDHDSREPGVKSRSRIPKAANDGTDDYLTDGFKTSSSRRESSASSSHADIQSIQEAAEIQGKVVLLMRGGCGFLEKVMWAQRRGAIGVIVGDNQKGGPLIQMFAHGEEVDNVTVPSVFTTRTTAHLLSSLTQPGSFIEDSLDDSGNPVLKVQQGTKPKTNQKKPEPLSGRTAASPKRSLSSHTKRAAKPLADKVDPTKFERRGWFSRVFSWGHASRTVDAKSRPPTSGRLDWILVDDWSDERDKAINDGMGKSKKRPQEPHVSGDDFVIGVQDWRDPDLLVKSGSGSKKGHAADKGVEQKAASDSKKESTSKNAVEASSPKGGSITPGSGEYDPNKAASKDGKDASSKSTTQGHVQSGKSHGLISKLLGDYEKVDDKLDIATPVSDIDEPEDEAPVAPEIPSFEPHDGLWVTITPTSSASPFFDTLLVLVISPLVTLTVVYALLILRARIRRRRWRAPKSVVERLPVRTYHTVATSRSPSPRLPSPSSASPTTPLLQHNSPPRPRPRSRTTTGVMESDNFLAPSSAMPAPRPLGRRLGSRSSPLEKGSGGFSAEWRKYMGRQVECVVCLEEYVDGVSKVMSLPCGHEFHVDCITPWLTTRRRTCPICKGDVVRSLARGPRAGPLYEPYRDDSDDEPEAGGSGHRANDNDEDLEQGILSPQPHDAPRSNRGEGWLGMLSSSFGTRPDSRSRSPSRSRSRSPEDRSR